MRFEVWLSTFKLSLLGGLRLTTGVSSTIGRVILSAASLIGEGDLDLTTLYLLCRYSFCPTSDNFMLFLRSYV
jgi:hypothetical protein